MVDLDYGVLVNKKNPLPRDYVPLNLYTLDDNLDNFHKYMDPNLKPMLRRDIKSYIDKLLVALKEAGFDVIVDSGYRSFDYQKVILEKNLKNKGADAFNWVALPGCSEHQTGLAFDIAYFKNGEYSDDVKENDSEVLWLKRYAYLYGLILRFPKGKEDITGFQHECWHYRFVGLELAKYLYENDLTLEEYYIRKRVLN